GRRAGPTPAAVAVGRYCVPARDLPAGLRPLESFTSFFSLHHRRRLMNRFACLIAVGLLAACGTGARADVFRFDTDPFAGTNVLTTPGRQFVQNELFIPDFTIAEDRFSFDPNVFGVSPQVSFFNGFAANVPTSGLNVIVLR